jgi:putative tricarboxylic transport membrane protein
MRRKSGFYTRRMFLCSGAAAFAFAPSVRAAQSYPTRAITIVVPFPAGSVSDSITRQFGHHLSSSASVSVVIENKPGAGGMLGAASVARALPDGYTLVTTTNTTHSAVQALFKKVTYDPVGDFTHLAAVARVLTIVCVKSDSPFKSIEDLVRFAKDNPGKVEYGHGNSSGQVLAETLKSTNALDIVRISYRGVPQVLTDLLGGQIKLGVVDLPTALPLIQAGVVRALAVSTATRSVILPEIPSLNETVIPGYDLTPWFGFAGPAGLPKEVTDALGSSLRVFVDNSNIRKKLLELAVEASWVAPDEIGRFVPDQRQKWMRFVKAAGIEPE